MKRVIKMLLRLLHPKEVEEDLDRKAARIRQERREAERLLKEAQATLNGEEAWFLETRKRQQEEANKKSSQGGPHGSA